MAKEEGISMRQPRTLVLKELWRLRFLHTFVQKYSTSSLLLLLASPYLSSYFLPQFHISLYDVAGQIFGHEWVSAPRGGDVMLDEVRIVRLEVELGVAVVLVHESKSVFDCVRKS